MCRAQNVESISNIVCVSTRYDILCAHRTTYIYTYIWIRGCVLVCIWHTKTFNGGGSGGGVHLPCTYRNMSSCRPGDHFKYRILRSESNRQLKRQQQSHGHVGVVVKFANTCNRVCMCFLLREHILVIATWRIDKEEKRRRTLPNITNVVVIFLFVVVWATDVWMPVKDESLTGNCCCRRTVYIWYVSCKDCDN